MEELLDMTLRDVLENFSSIESLECGYKFVTLCPKCGGAELTYLHKKAKKSNNDWKCPACGAIFRTINLFMDLPEK